MNEIVKYIKIFYIFKYILLNNDYKSNILLQLG